MSSLLDQFSTYATKVDDTLVSSVTSCGDTSRESVRGAARVIKKKHSKQWRPRGIMKGVRRENIRTSRARKHVRFSDKVEYF